MSPIIKRKGERFTIPSKYLLFILTFVCTGMMVLTFGTDIFNKPLNTAVGYLVVPYQQGISKLGGWLSDRSDELVQIRQLLDENASLSNQVSELTAENIILQQDKYELNRLRELFKLDEQYAEYEKVAARIVGPDSSNWYSSFFIDKGEDDGFAIDMNVLALGGLVGKITAIGPNWAKVTTIISDNSNVSAMTLATGDRMNVAGDLQLMNDGVIKFSMLQDAEDKVSEGDKIVTSNFSSKYLPNILIGYIHTINRDPNNLTKSGYITPAVDFQHLKEVFVITELKQQIDETN